MSLTLNGTEVKEITFNGTKVDKLNYGGVEVYSSLPAPGKPLNDYTWSEIQQITQAGKAPEYFSVGDRKEVILNGTAGRRTLSNYKWYCFILGFNHNAAKEGNNTIHFQFGFNALSGGVCTALISEYKKQSHQGYPGSGFCMNFWSSDTDKGGWESSLMRTRTIPEFRNCLPSDLKSVLKTITKYTCNGNDDSAASVTATQDDIFLLANYEIFGSKGYAHQYEYTGGKQAQYDYYKSGNSKIMYNDQSTGTAIWWWERSRRYPGSWEFCCVLDDGSAASHYAASSFGFAPGFCVG